MNSTQGRARWSRSDKISIAAIIIALLGAAGGIGTPYLVSWVKHFNNPQVTIITPANGAKEADNGFGARGTASNIPAGSDLWLIVRAGVAGIWYPFNKLSIDNDQWYVKRHSICTGAGPQDIEIFLVPYASDDQLVTFVNSSEQIQKLGINSLPPGATLEAASDVLVPAKYVC